MEDGGAATTAPNGSPPGIKNGPVDHDQSGDADSAHHEESVHHQERVNAAVNSSLAEREVSTIKAVGIPGCKPWEDCNIVALRKHAGTAFARYNDIVGDYVRSVSLHHHEHFTLRPLIIDSGPLDGRHILMLEPLIVDTDNQFRFMDLPIELRKMVYAELMVDAQDVECETIKVYKGSSRRAVRKGFTNTNAHRGLEWNKTAKKWIGQPHSNFMILRVCAEVNEEAAQVAYGSNRFRFYDATHMAIWLKGIGGMRHHLRVLHLSGGYRDVKMPSIFRALRNATNLRIFSIEHDAITRYKATILPKAATIATHCSKMVKHLQHAKRFRLRHQGVLNIVQIVSEYSKHCYDCKRGHKCSMYRRCCKVACKDLPDHVANLNAAVRSILAKKLGFEDTEASEIDAAAACCEKT